VVAGRSQPVAPVFPPNGPNPRNSKASNCNSLRLRPHRPFPFLTVLRKHLFHSHRRVWVLAARSLCRPRPPSLLKNLKLPFQAPCPACFAANAVGQVKPQRPAGRNAPDDVLAQAAQLREAARATKSARSTPFRCVGLESGLRSTGWHQRGMAPRAAKQPCWCCRPRQWVRQVNLNVRTKPLLRDALAEEARSPKRNKMGAFQPP